jgi:hypothetical protein
VVSFLQKVVNSFRKNKKRVTITLGAATTVSAIYLFMILTALGVVITSNGNIVCGGICESEVYLSNFTKDITINNLSALQLDFSPNPKDWDLLFPTKTGYASFSELKSFTFKQGKNYTLILRGEKANSQTIKWTLKFGNAVLDPFWYGTGSNFLITVPSYNYGGNSNWATEKLVRDSQGNYYAAYYDTSQYPRLMNSSDGGANWTTGSALVSSSSTGQSLAINSTNGLAFAYVTSSCDINVAFRQANSTGSWTIQTPFDGTTTGVTCFDTPSIQYDGNDVLQMVFRIRALNGTSDKIGYTNYTAASGWWGDGSVNNVTNTFNGTWVDKTATIGIANIDMAIDTNNNVYFLGHAINGLTIYRYSTTNLSTRATTEVSGSLIGGVSLDISPVDNMIFMVQTRNAITYTIGYNWSAATWLTGSPTTFSPSSSDDTYHTHIKINQTGYKFVASPPYSQNPMQFAISPAGSSTWTHDIYPLDIPFGGTGHGFMNLRGTMFPVFNRINNSVEFLTYNDTDHSIYFGSWNLSSPPQWSNNLTTGTFAINSNVTHNLTWSDPFGMDGYIFYYSNGQPSWGYQETATVADSWFAKSTGSYSCDANWDGTFTCARVYDGSWSTQGASGGTTANLYFNYTKPDRAVFGSMLVHAQDSATPQNDTIPSACWNYNSSKVAFRVSVTSGNVVTWYCDSGSWTTINQTSGGNPFDEGVWWNLSAGFIPDAFVDISGTPINATATKTLPGVVGQNIGWYFWANDTFGNAINSDIYNYTTIAPPAPLWSLNSTSGTVAGSSVTFSVFWNSTPSVLSYFIFGWSNGGNWTMTNTTADLETGTQSFSGTAGSGETYSGITTVGGTQGYYNNNYYVGQRITATASGQMTKTSVYLVRSVTNNCKMALYSTGKALLAQSDEVSVTATGWWNFTYASPYSVTSGTDYDVESWCGGSATQDYTRYASDAAATWSYKSSTYGAWADPGGYTTSTGRNVSIYMTIGSGGSGDNETNKTAVTYSDVFSNGLYEMVSSINVTVNVTAYNNSGSVARNNLNNTILLEIYNGTGWHNAGLFNVIASGNYSIYLANLTVLAAWTTTANRDIRLQAVYMDWNDTGHFDTINWTDVSVVINSEQEYLNDTQVSFSGTYNWSNVTKTITSTVGVPVKWYVYAMTTSAVSNITDTFSFTTTSGGGGGAPDINVTLGPGISAVQFKPTIDLDNPPTEGNPLYVNATNQTAANFLFNVTNNGTASGTVRIRVTVDIMNRTIQCFRDSWGTGQVNLSASFQNIKTPVAANLSFGVWCQERINSTVFARTARNIEFNITS